MVVHKRKKNSRQRGSKWHGWGKGQAHHKGSGNKGGVGNAGSGKRADCKKPSYWKLPTGRNGFIPKGTKLEILPINVQRVEELIDNGTLKEENGIYDLGKIGYNKLLNKGNVSKKMKIKVLRASENVIATIKELGGEVILGSEEKVQ